MSVYSDWAILAIFTLEMFLKMIAFGIGYKPPLEPDVDPELAGYFAGAWNRLDSFIGNNFSKSPSCSCSKYFGRPLTF